MNKSNIGKSRQKTPRISSHRISIHPPVHQILAPEECSQRFSRLATTSSSDALNTKAGSKEISLDGRFGGSVPEAPPIHHFDLALSGSGCILSLIPPLFFGVYSVHGKLVCKYTCVPWICHGQMCFKNVVQPFLQKSVGNLNHTSFCSWCKFLRVLPHVRNP